MQLLYVPQCAAADRAANSVILERAANSVILEMYALKPFKELGLNSQRVTCFQASCSFCQLHCQTCPY